MDGEDARVLAWTRAKVGQLVAHAREHHADNARTVALLQKLKDVRLMSRQEAGAVPGSWRSGKFKHSTGVLYVTPVEQDGSARTEQSLLKTIIHELAHATRFKTAGEDSHSQEWKQTWLWLLQLATQDLGWRVEVKCAQCTYYGLCDEAQCPKCVWLQNLCKPYLGAER